MEALLKEGRAVITSSDALLIMAGAGMGVDSGLPDFRGDAGFWKAYPPIKKLGYSFAEMANPRWFQDNPRLAWAFYGHRLALYRSTIPHHGFAELLRVGNEKPGGCFVFTSNVDGQFQKAGFHEIQVMECHGSIHHLQCSTHCVDAIWPATDVRVTIDAAKFEATGGLPTCEYCGGIARPNILMFGDWGWQEQRTQMQEQRLLQWLSTVKTAQQRLAIVEIGAGEAVPTVRQTSEHIAREFGATLIRINPRDYQVPEGHIGLALGGLEGILKLLGE